VSVGDSTAPAAAPRPVAGTVTPADEAPIDQSHPPMARLIGPDAPGQLPAQQPASQPPAPQPAARVRRARQGQWTPPQSPAPDTRPASLWPNQQTWTDRQPRQTSGTRAPRRSSNPTIWIGIAIAVVVFAGVVASAGSSQTIQYPPETETPYLVFDDTPLPTSEDTATASPVASPVAFPPIDSLVATGALNQARAEHTATLLPDGRVLIAGGIAARATDGSVANPPLTSIEVYDPKTRLFTPAGDLVEARADHTATLLPDGTVLFAGGKDADGQALSSAEVYDPATRQSRQVSNMNDARFSAAAVALDDGTVLIVGGEASGGVWEAEIYLTSEEKFRPIADQAPNGGAVTANKLPDGRVVVAGGDPMLATAGVFGIYDPQTGSFDSATGIDARLGATSCLLADGRILVVGGLGAVGDATATAQLYDPGQGSTDGPISLAAPRFHSTTTALPDGSALIVGGSDDSGRPISSVERYFPGSSTTTPVGMMSVARSGHTATLLQDGSVLIAGGWSSSTAATAEASLFDTGPVPVPPASTASPAASPAASPTSPSASPTAPN